MESSHSINLDEFRHPQEGNEDIPRSAVGRISNSEVEISLPRADEGKDAWLFLASCFVVEALVWGRQTEYQFPVSIFTYDA